MRGPQLRRLPALARLHEWLVQGNLYGSIVRQEAVSMVPPLFLDVQPHQVVLDMCAAPGSKTSQLLEALHTSSSDGGVPGALPPGCVIANDADLARCNMLTHQLKRSASPALVVINHDAARLPAPRNVASGQQLRFDRVLADVPCTGDGTLRKAPDLWRKWHVHMGIGIHNLQVSIARRGAALLQTGGRMVYSTCSMNPLEDEAVVAALLRASEGALRLVDTTGQLPELRRSPGMSTWLVMDKSGVRELDAGLVGSARTLARSMFPPSSEEADAMHLYRCMRFLPHHGDTGGFFVAVIEKVSDWPPPPAHTAAHPSSEPKADAGAAEDGDGEDEPAGGGDVQQPTPQEQHRPDGAGSSRQRTAQRTAIDPVNAVTDDWILNTLQSFYGFGPNFPLRGTLYMRMGDFDTLDGAAATGAQAPKPKRLYAVSPGAASLLASDEKRRLKVMSAGVKLFEKGHDAVSKATCPYRITQEGLHWVLPHLGKQLARVNVNQLARLVRRRVLFFETPRNGGDSAGAAGAPMMDADSITALLALTQGCVVLVPLLGSSSEAEADDLAVVAWKGAISVAVMVNKQESPILQARLDKFLDPGELDRQKAEAAAHKSKGTQQHVADEPVLAAD